MTSELIAVAMAPCQQFVNTVRKTWENGNAVLPIDLRLPQRAQQRVIDSMAPSALIDNDGNVTSVPNGRPVEPGDALVMSTSGTTGEPKGVVLTHEALTASALMTSKRLDVSTEDHWLCCIPVAHIGGFSVISRALLTDTKLTVLPAFDPEAVESATRNGCTLVALVTPAMQRIDTTLFRAIVLGAGNVPTALPDNVFPTYGMTETASGIYYRDAPLDGVELRVVNDEIHIKSPTLLRCYRDGRDPKLEDGFLPSGDSGFFDESGKLYVLGRIGDMINTGGEKVWPAEVEQTLRIHPAVIDALVFGEADPQWGQRVVATIETQVEIDTDELRDFLKEYLPGYAVPKELRVVEALARTPLGKVKRPNR